MKRIALFLATNLAIVRAALRRLQTLHEPSALPDKLAAFGISGGASGGIRRLFMTHPPFEERNAALQAAEGAL